METFYPDDFKGFQDESNDDEDLDETCLTFCMQLEDFEDRVTKTTTTLRQEYDVLIVEDYVGGIELGNCIIVGRILNTIGDGDVVSCDILSEIEKFHKGSLELPNSQLSEYGKS